MKKLFTNTMPKKKAPSVIYKKGMTVEVKGDQIGGGSQWALHWFRGKVKNVSGRGAKVRYDVKIEDPTRFNKKSLICKGLAPRYVRRDAPAAKGISKEKKKKSASQKKAYGLAGEGGACESWEQTIAREAKERALEQGKSEEEAEKIYQETLGPGFVPPGSEPAAPPDSPKPKEMTEDDKRKYQKGKDIRKKVDVVEGDGWKLLDRYTLEFGSGDDVKVFKANEQVEWKGEKYDLKRIRMYKGVGDHVKKPVLMIEKDAKGIRKVEVKDCIPIAPPPPEPKPEEKEEEEAAAVDDKKEGEATSAEAEKKEEEPAEKKEEEPAGDAEKKEEEAPAKADEETPAKEADKEAPAKEADKEAPAKEEAPLSIDGPAEDAAPADEAPAEEDAPAEKELSIDG